MRHMPQFEQFINEKVNIKKEIKKNETFTII